MSLPGRVDAGGAPVSLSVDFVDPERGVSGLVRVDRSPASPGVEGRGVLVAPDQAARIGEARVSGDGERERAVFEADGARFEIECTRGPGASFEPGSAFSDAAGVSQAVFAARVRGEWRADGSQGQIRCLGRLVRTRGQIARDRIELVRSLTAAFEDGSLLGVAAARPVGAAGHGEEVVSALLCDADGSVERFEEALLSTEYDADGRHRRAGVELWNVDEASPLRGAGTLIAAAGETSFMRFTLNGIHGTARYEIVTAPGA